MTETLETETLGTRLAHAIVYALGIPVARTLAFAVGFGAQVVLALAVFGWA